MAAPEIAVEAPQVTKKRGKQQAGADGKIGFSARLTPELRDAVRELAKRRGCRIEDVVEQAIAREVTPMLVEAENTEAAKQVWFLVETPDETPTEALIADDQNPTVPLAEVDGGV